jgi:polyribonucleotide nucleotidyltransferase
MVTQEFINKIRDAVKNNRLEVALDELEKITDDIDLQTSIVLLKNRFQKLKKEKMLGIADRQASDTEHNRITLGVMGILNEVLTEEGRSNEMDETAVLKNLLEVLENNKTTFLVQSRIRKQLVKSLRERFPEIKTRNILKLMSSCYEKMNAEELKMHRSIRGWTESLIKKHNEEINKLIEAHPKVKDKIPRLKELQQHIRLWLIKYDSTFVGDESVSVVYMNIQEGFPFPKGIENEIEEYLKRNTSE